MMMMLASGRSVFGTVTYGTTFVNLVAKRAKWYLEVTGHQFG